VRGGKPKKLTHGSGGNALRKRKGRYPLSKGDPPKEGRGNISSWPEGKKKNAPLVLS